MHNVTFYGAPLADLEAYWAALGVSRLSILDSQLLDPEFPMLLQRNDYTVEAVYHLFAGGSAVQRPAGRPGCPVRRDRRRRRRRRAYRLPAHRRPR